MKTGGFFSPEEADGVDTLHLYEEMEGFEYVLRIYYYEGRIYELFSSVEAELEPQDGTPVMDAQGLSFEQQGNLIHIISKDLEGRENEATVSLRCRESGVAS